MADFARKTGDFASLSLTDMRLLALTYQLEVRFPYYSRIPIFSIALYDCIVTAMNRSVTVQQ